MNTTVDVKVRNSA